MRCRARCLHAQRTDKTHPPPGSTPGHGSPTQSRRNFPTEWDHGRRLVVRLVSPEGGPRSSPIWIWAPFGFRRKQNLARLSVWCSAHSTIECDVPVKSQVARAVVQIGTESAGRRRLRAITAVVRCACCVGSVTRNCTHRGAVLGGQCPLDTVKRAPRRDAEAYPQLRRAAGWASRVRRGIGDPEPDGKSDGSDRTRRTDGRWRSGTDLAHGEVHRCHGVVGLTVRQKGRLVREHPATNRRNGPGSWLDHRPPVRRRMGCTQECSRRRCRATSARPWKAAGSLHARNTARFECHNSMSTDLFTLRLAGLGPPPPPPPGFPPPPPPSPPPPPVSQGMTTPFGNVVGTHSSAVADGIGASSMRALASASPAAIRTRRAF